MRRAQNAWQQSRASPSPNSKPEALLPAPLKFSILVLGGQIIDIAEATAHRKMTRYVPWAIQATAFQRRGTRIMPPHGPWAKIPRRSHRVRTIKPQPKYRAPVSLIEHLDKLMALSVEILSIIQLRMVPLGDYSMFHGPWHPRA